MQTTRRESFGEGLSDVLTTINALDFAITILSALPASLIAIDDLPKKISTLSAEKAHYEKWLEFYKTRRLNLGSEVQDGKN